MELAFIGPGAIANIQKYFSDFCFISCVIFIFLSRIKVYSMIF